MASTSAPPPSSSSPWPPDPIPPVGYLSRKALPIKRNDAESLTREDVQYDLLNHIFSDQTAVFTPQTPGKASKLAFRDLYINALYNSSKCSKVLKEKMVDTPAFALEFAKICLLTNVGRINTTMAFFPEMKTALRTYHPVPSLQKTDGNAQDAPRIKNCLKAALLPSELKTLPPSSPDEILLKLRSGKRPPTSVVNLVFVLSNHAAPLARVHFDGTVNFLDFFLPKPLASADRARAFLWFMYHYLESPTGSNPFDDDYSRKHLNMAPYLRSLNQREASRENVDTEDEIIWGNMMSNQRNIFLHKLVSSMESDKKAKPVAPHFVPAAPEASSSMGHRPGQEPSRDEAPFMFYVPGREPTPSREVNEQDTPLLLPDSRHNRRHQSEQHQQNQPPTAPPQYIRHRQPPQQPLPRHQTIPIRPRSHIRTYSAPISRQEEGRPIVQQAFHMALNSDPLLDSDEENADDNLRVDYRRRLDVLTRIRGRPPTPDLIPPQEQHFYSARLP
ncbi:uncharacterized protein BT62DRAFT_927633 [Guyanagaster necrorhizus]|uniref:Ino eighty subunit 1 n=1 Tax=Guyanagaster necrorhizus TaxID=856835 RepID=A0A9P7VZ75_9AGAR|nr:uncharacterized protein BT62DRAFT_927633 [Guyanagaster necrorhizus MCA 3950]KAG7450316.1 hypothetical protein BT62DRAFT_927633 [Guyanagaster necrorhizus MCA 3950]